MANMTGVSLRNPSISTHPGPDSSHLVISSVKTHSSRQSFSFISTNDTNSSRFALAPIYDISPMAFASDRRGCALVAVTNSHRCQYWDKRSAAGARYGGYFWQTVVKHCLISEALKQRKILVNDNTSRQKAHLMHMH